LTDISGFDQWLSLGDASALLGVHASTLRRWADGGRVPCQRTPGGHRRFNRQQLLDWVEGAQQPSAAVSPSTTVEDRAWYRRFAEAGRLEDVRAIGQRLSGLAVQHLLRHGGEERYLDDAESLGQKYAAASRGVGVSFAEAVDAIGYFRVALVPAVSQMITADLGDCARQLGRYEELMNRVLVGLVAGYEA